MVDACTALHLSFIKFGTDLAVLNFTLNWSSAWDPKKQVRQKSKWLASTVLCLFLWGRSSRYNLCIQCWFGSFKGCSATFPLQVPSLAPTHHLSQQARWLSGCKIRWSRGQSSSSAQAAAVHCARGSLAKSLAPKKQLFKCFIWSYVIQKRCRCSML